MTTVRLWTDHDAAQDPAVGAVFADIRATRRSDFINNIWRALANNAPLLERTWSGVKAVMVAESALDPLTKELVYIAVSNANGCGYCVHSHTAAARAKGMTDAQHADLMRVMAMAAQTNSLATALQLPVDPEFLVAPG